MSEEAQRLRGLLLEAHDAMHPAVVMFLALKRQGLGSKAHELTLKTYRKIEQEIGHERL